MTARKAGTCILAHNQVSPADSAGIAAMQACLESTANGGAIIMNRMTAMRAGVAAAMPDTTVKPKTKVRPKVEQPKLYKVILVNDDFTPREFVVRVLQGEFRMTEDQAHNVMITAHRLGVCVVAVFTKDIAETKATRATDAGRAKGYPLLFTTEPEE
jgi:ATP-dependent Clp protease adaptor protein ClpS